MTNRNTSWNADRGNVPFLLKPAGKDYLWGGTRLRDDFNKEIGLTPLAELWYVLDAAPDARIVYGFNRDVTKGRLRQGVADGSIEKLVQRIPVKKDDVFYIAAGTVHAIGAGTLVAEIQENSNLTYRLYDYGRVDKDGKERELHVDKALQVANLRGSPAPKQPLRVLRYRAGCASELLCRCRYFEVNRMIVNTQRCRELASFRSDRMSFRVLLCTDGCGSVYYGKESFGFFRGGLHLCPG